MNEDDISEVATLIEVNHQFLLARSKLVEGISNEIRRKNQIFPTNFVLTNLQKAKTYFSNQDK